MSGVTGSKQPRLVVVPHRPWRGLAMGIALLALLVCATVLSFYGGYHQGTSLQTNAVAERDRLRADVVDLNSEAEALRQQVVNLQLGAQVDHKANEEVRNQVIGLQEKITALEEDISFYRGLMSPSANSRGLTIGALNVISTGASREFEYKLVMQQLATDHQLLSGYLNFSIVGRRGDEEVAIPLYQVSDQVEEANIPLRFKYFQNVAGRLTLPDGFEPQRIEVKAQTTGNNRETVEKKFGWLVQEY